MNQAVPVILRAYEISKQANSHTGYPHQLQDTMTNCLKQGHSYAQSMEYARLLGYDSRDIQAWVAGRRLEVARQRSLGMARKRWLAAKMG